MARIEAEPATAVGLYRALRCRRSGESTLRPCWFHEIKHDGYRMQLRKRGNRVRLFTRRGFDWTERYRWVVQSAFKLKAEDVTLDGELVCAGHDGIAEFSRLHSRRFDHEAFLYVFDLLEVGGEDWRSQPAH